MRLPFALIRVRLAKDGFEDAEGTVEPRPDPPFFILDAAGARPPGMVTVPQARPIIAGQPADLPAFWLDKYEVTNRQFKSFVDQGGYRKREYWKQYVGTGWLSREPGRLSGGWRELVRSRRLRRIRRQEPSYCDALAARGGGRPVLRDPPTEQFRRARASAGRQIPGPGSVRHV
jgi:Sulfatase-modifying factor enzyme 1